MDFRELENAAAELISAFGVTGPPVPVEAMLQNPLPGMWDEVDISLVSGSFMTIGDPYVPRMSLARVLARHLVNSDWGATRRLDTIRNDTQLIHMLARIIVMPRPMIELLAPQARNPRTIGDHFEAPYKDAMQRLDDLNHYD